MTRRLTDLHARCSEWGNFRDEILKDWYRGGWVHPYRRGAKHGECRRSEGVLYCRGKTLHCWSRTRQSYRGGVGLKYGKRYSRVTWAPRLRDPRSPHIVTAHGRKGMYRR